jgi:hypothetical protein
MLQASGFVNHLGKWARFKHIRRRRRLCNDVVVVEGRNRAASAPQRGQQPMPKFIEAHLLNQRVKTPPRCRGLQRKTNIDSIDGSVATKNEDANKMHWTSCVLRALSSAWTVIPRDEVILVSDGKEMISILSIVISLS